LFIYAFILSTCHTVWCLSKSYAHNNNCKKSCKKRKEKREKRKEKKRKKKIKQKKNTTTQIGANVRARRFNAGLLARSQFASGRSCDRPTRSRVSVVFLGLRTNAELVPKFHVALHASHTALRMVTLKISPYTNVTLTFDFGLDHPVHGGYE
jgi:hypothetical protein